MPHEAQSSRRTGLFLFKDTIRPFLPSAKNAVVGRFLPGFDWTMNPQDPAFATAFTPYRDKHTAHPKTGQPVFTRWLVPIDVFDGLGADGRDTVIANNSRAALIGAEQVTQADRQDAFSDVHRVASAKAKVDPTYKNLVESVGNNRPIVPRSTTKVMFNILGVRDNSWQVAPMGMSYTGYEHLCALADQFPNPAEPLLDPEWPFLYGDFTSPANGLQFVTCQALGSNRRPFNTIQFSTRANTTMGTSKVPVGQDILAQRVNVWSPDVYAWMTYQEQVDYLVHNTQVPMDIIHEACSMRASIPQRPHQASYFPPGQAQPGFQPVAGGYQLPPQQGYPQQPAYQPPQQPAYQPPPPQQGYPPQVPPQQSAPPLHGYPAAPGPGAQVQLPPPPQVPTPAVPSANTLPTAPPSAAQVPGLTNVPLPGYQGVPMAGPMMTTPTPAPATFQPPPGYSPPDYIPGIAGDPNLAQGPRPETSALAAAPPLAPPPPPAGQAGEPGWPPPGWLPHPQAPGQYYQGQEVVTEAQLRARYAPVPAAAQPGVPAPQALPAATPGAGQGGAPMPQDMSEARIREILGPEADEFLRLEAMTRSEGGMGMTSPDIERFVALGIRLHNA